MLLAALVALAWLATGWLDGPMGMIPGGAFRGEGEPCPAAGWERFADAREVEVEVRPERPRSITTWSVVHQGAFYLPADFLTPWKRWPYQVLADPRIRLRLAERIFACRVERVEDPDLVEALREATGAKYDVSPDGLAARVEVWWFRVLPR